MRKKINNLLNSNKELLTEIYFKIQDEFEKEYINTVVLMEIGSFFEIYEYNNKGKAKEISELLNIQLTKKNKSIQEITKKNPLMAGFPSHALDRYLQKIVDENKYTVVIIKQEGTPPNIKRYLYDIITPSINIENENKEGNYLTSVVIQKIKGIYYVGYSSIDINIGKTNVSEIYSEKNNKTYALDILFNLLNTYKTNEILFFLDIDEKDNMEKEINFIKNYLEINDKIIYKFKKFKEFDITYINEVFKYVYNIKSIISPLEYLNMEKMILVPHSLIYAIEHIHDKELIKNLKLPKLINISNYVMLGNNPIKQLEIDKILKLIDKTKTAMGKRLIKERLFNPIYDEKELEKRYSMIEWLLKEKKYLKFIEQLNNIYDLERLNRKIKIQKIHPFEIHFLLKSLEALIVIYKLLNKDVIQIEDYVKEIKRIFNLDKLNVKIEQINDSFFNKGIFKEIDALKEKYNYEYNKLLFIKKEIEELLPDSINCELKENNDGFYFTLTKKRFNSIKKDFLNKIINIENEKIFFNDFKIKILTTTVKIENGILDKISEKIYLYRKKIEEKTKEKYLEVISEFNLKYPFLLEMANFIAEIDVSCSNAYIANKYKYYKPKLINKNENVFKDLRHPLIETNEENGIYISNDISFKEYKGLLLYGINSAGKSSLMKSLGITIILAQAGFYVPAIIEYKPYKKIFTRINAEDNLQKGLSTFAVEMLELKNILRNADDNTIILGDEIAHGTEIYSALGIVGSTILELLKRNSNFIFTTHLHQLVEIPEIIKNKKLAIKHLEVYFDGEKLIYNRKLKDGNGIKTYGLEFVKSIYMDENFIKKAEEIRKLFDKN